VEKTMGKFLRNLHGKHPIVFPKSMVNVYIPKFKLESETDLKGPLQKVGITDMFTNRADFSDMVGKASTKVSVMKQKAFIEVNEDGTEAAAATADVQVPLPSVTPKTKTFKADRPFIFLIRENVKGVTLFSGRVVDPNKE